MGDRAVIAMSTAKSAPALYLHWGGAPEVILAMLEVCKIRVYRDPCVDESYAFARLVGVAHEMSPDWAGVGVSSLGQSDVDNGDNGAYLIGPGWAIHKRWGTGGDQRKSASDLSKEEVERMNRTISSLMPGRAT